MIIPFRNRNVRLIARKHTLVPAANAPLTWMRSRALDLRRSALLAAIEVSAACRWRRYSILLALSVCDAEPSAVSGPPCPTLRLLPTLRLPIVL